MIRDTLARLVQHLSRPPHITLVMAVGIDESVVSVDLYIVTWIRSPVLKLLIAQKSLLVSGPASASTSS